ALIVAFFHFSLIVYLGWKQPAWSAFAEKRRFAILLALVLAVVGIKIGEDAVNQESGPFDVLVLQLIHANVPPALDGIFAAATVTGSASVLFPLVLIVDAALLSIGRRFEALLLTVSVVSSALIVYAMKAAVGRARRALWDTEWYWGSSFPSGHTLVVSAFATAMVICLNRIWPGSRACREHQPDRNRSNGHGRPSGNDRRACDGAKRMSTTVFTEVRFWLLVVFSGVLPSAIYWMLLVKRAISRSTVLLLGLSLVAIAGVDVYLLQSLATQAKLTSSLADDAVFVSEVSIALYLLPAMFGGLGSNIISHVLVSHLVEAETRSKAENGDG